MQFTQLNGSNRNFSFCAWMYTEKCARAWLMCARTKDRKTSFHTYFKWRREKNARAYETHIFVHRFTVHSIHLVHRTHICCRRACMKDRNLLTISIEGFLTSKSNITYEKKKGKFNQFTYCHYFKHWGTNHHVYQQ